MSFPTVRFRVGFDTDPLAALVSPSDLSARVEAFTFDYGKQSASDEFQPGTSTVTLKNDDRELDSLNAAGAYYGKLKPRRRQDLQVSVGGVDYPQFTTFADGWPQSGFTPTTSEVVLAGTDLFILLGNIDLPASVWQLEVAADSPLAWFRLGETIGTTAFDSVAGHNGVYNIPIDRLTTDGLVAYDDDKAIDSTPLDDQGFLGGGSTPVSTVPVAVFDTAAVPTGLPVVLEVVTRPRLPAVGDTNGMWLFLSTCSTFELELLLSSDAVSSAQIRADWSPNATSAGRYAWSSNNIPFDATYVIGVKFDTGVEELWVNGASVAISSGALAVGHTIKSAIAIGGQYPDKSNGVYTGVIDEVLLFNSALSSARLAAHGDAALTPWTSDTTGERIGRILDYCGVAAGDRDIDTGIVILGPTGLGGDALTYMQKVARTEDGQLFVEHRNGGVLTFYDRFVRYTATRSTTSQATFTDDPAASAPAYRFEPDGLVLTDDESQIVNEAVVQWDQGEVRVSDAASITAHGRKSRTYETFHKTVEEAQSYAEWIVANYKDSHVRVESITLNPAADSRLWPVALGLRYLDRVTFRFKPQNVGTAIQQDYWIQGIHVEANEGVNHWLTTYYLTPASAVGADVEVFILDSSLLDGAAILA